GAWEAGRRRRVDLQTLGRAGRGGQRPQGGRVHRGHPGGIVEVHELGQVAELHAVFHPDVLVLVVEVLPGLAEPGRGVTVALERTGVGAAQVPVAPPDQPDVHAGQVERRHRVDEPAELAGFAVVLPADRRYEGDIARGRVGRDA